MNNPKAAAVPMARWIGTPHSVNKGTESEPPPMPMSEDKPQRYRLPIWAQGRAERFLRRIKLRLPKDKLNRDQNRDRREETRQHNTG